MSLSLAPGSASSDGAATFTMKMSRITMKTGANRTGNRNGLLRFWSGGRITGFNGWLPAVVRSALAAPEEVCDHDYAGTREGFILVPTPPAKQVEHPRARTTNGGAGAGTTGYDAARADGLAAFLRTRYPA